jgi:hypothetical protein
MDDGAGNRDLASVWSRLPKLVRRLLVVAVVGPLAYFGAKAFVEWDYKDRAAHPDADWATSQASRRIRSEMKRLLPEAFEDVPGEPRVSEAFRLADFMKANADKIGEGSSASITRVIEGRLKALRILQAKNALACAATVRTWRVDPHASPEAYLALTDSTLASLQAMREGLDHPAGRGPRTPGDRAAFTAALDRRGVTEPLRTLVVRPSAVSAAPPADQCDAGIALYDTILTLPPDIRSRTFMAVANAVRLTSRPEPAEEQ